MPRQVNARKRPPRRARSNTFNPFFFFEVLIFGIPGVALMLLLLFGLGSLIFGKRTGPSVTGECSIKGVADGTVMKQTIKGVEEESCLLYFLPGSFAEIGLGAKDYFDCAMLDYGLRGHLTSIREPGKIGLSVPKITVCFASYPGTSAPTKRS